jgi:hypothetical protein
LERLLREQPEVVGGNFRLLFEGKDGFSRWLTGFYALIRRLGFYYGDSGIFVRRAALDAIGGVRPIALMEDYDLVRRLRRAGPSCGLPAQAAPTGVPFGCRSGVPFAYVALSRAPTVRGSWRR